MDFMKTFITPALWTAVILSMMVVGLLVGCEQTIEEKVAQGSVLKEKGEFDEAIKAFEEALAMDANHFGAITGLALVYKAKKDYLKAEECFLKAKDLDKVPRSSRDWLNNELFGLYLEMAKNYLESDDFKKNPEKYEEILKNAMVIKKKKAEPLLATYYLNKAVELDKADKYDEAKALYEKVLDMRIFKKDRRLAKDNLDKMIYRNWEKNTRAGIKKNIELLTPKISEMVAAIDPEAPAILTVVYSEEAGTLSCVVEKPVSKKLKPGKEEDELAAGQQILPLPKLATSLFLYGLASIPITAKSDFIQLETFKIKDAKLVEKGRFRAESSVDTTEIIEYLWVQYKEKAKAEEAKKKEEKKGAVKKETKKNDVKTEKKKEEKKGEAKTEKKTDKKTEKK